MTIDTKEIFGPVNPADIHIVQKSWGHERWCVNTPLYCGKELFFFNGRSCSFHYHRIKDETFLVTQGGIQIRWVRPVGKSYEWWRDEELLAKEKLRVLYYSSHVRLLSVGDVFRVPVGMIHQMTGVGDSKLIEFSTHHEDSDSYRLIFGEPG